VRAHFQHKDQERAHHVVLAAHAQMPLPQPHRPAQADTIQWQMDCKNLKSLSTFDCIVHAPLAHLATTAAVVQVRLCNAPLDSTHSESKHLVARALQALIAQIHRMALSAAPLATTPRQIPCMLFCLA
jgi:hypothetical protein